MSYREWQVDKGGSRSGRTWPACEWVGTCPQEGGRAWTRATATVPEQTRTHQKTNRPALRGLLKGTRQGAFSATTALFPSMRC